MSGWHDRLKAEARNCLANQFTESDKRLPEAGLNNGFIASRSTPPLLGKSCVNAF